MIFSSSDTTPINDLPEDVDITDKFKYIQNQKVQDTHRYRENYSDRFHVEIHVQLQRS